MADPLDARIFLSVDNDASHGAYTTVYVEVVGDTEEHHLAITKRSEHVLVDLYRDKITHQTMFTVSMTLTVGEYALLLLRFKK